LIAGWKKATEAEAHHGLALEALFERGDTGEAKKELINGVESYRAAQAAFESAYMGAESIGAIRDTHARLRERAGVVSNAFGPTQAMLRVGRVFIVFFFVTLAVMVALRHRLAVRGTLVVWISLVVSIIGAFGLHAKDILEAVKSVPTFQQGSR
jgi:hypothetical protein